MAAHSFARDVEWTHLSKTLPDTLNSARAETCRQNDGGEHNLIKSRIHLLAAGNVVTLLLSLSLSHSHLKLG